MVCRSVGSYNFESKVSRLVSSWSSIFSRCFFSCRFWFWFWFSVLGSPGHYCYLWILKGKMWYQLWYPNLNWKDRSKSQQFHECHPGHSWLEAAPFQWHRSLHRNCWRSKRRSGERCAINLNLNLNLKPDSTPSASSLISYTPNWSIHEFVRALVDHGLRHAVEWLGW